MFKEWVKEIYDRYVIKVDKVNKISKCRRVLQELGIEGGDDFWSPKTGDAKIRVCLSEIEDDGIRILLSEIREYLYANDIEIVSTTEDIQEGDSTIPIRYISRAQELFNNIIVREDKIYVPVTKKDSINVYLVFIY
ncbi:MAG: hypothetical protein QW607_12370 [Desulfurococcaceae archaeon]